MSLDQYSQTPASNDLPGYGATGMRPSFVKNAFWDFMADVCMQIGAGSLPTTGGTANAQTITNTRQIGALYAGLRFRVLPSATNTGAMTFAPDGLAAENVFANGVAAIAGMWVRNVPADIVYDGTQWNLMNPQTSKGSYTTTFVGGPGTATVNYTILPDGDDCTLRMPSSVGAGAGTTFTMTAPANLIPANQSVVPIYAEDQTALAGAVLLVGTSSPWTFQQTTNISLSGAWVASGNRGINRANQIIHYKLLS